MQTSRHSERSHRARLPQAAALCCLALIAGCSSVESFYDSKLSLDQPIDWWHQLQGGEIAEQRPPPPGINDPYPNLSQVPPRPTPTDPATRRALITQLTAERNRANQLAAQDPITFPTAAPPKPAAVAGSVPGDNPESTSATPSSATPGSATPGAAAETSTLVLDAANAPPAPANSPPPPDASVPASAAADGLTSGPIPALPVSAPPLPALPGLPTSVAAPVVERPRPSAQFRFAPGSAALPQSADAALRTLAARRADAPIRVMAGGDARSSAPGAQRQALPLALRRTGAMTAALIAAGVPSAAIRAEGVAPGREASARLIE